MIYAFLHRRPLPKYPTTLHSRWLLRTSSKAARSTTPSNIPWGLRSKEESSPVASYGIFRDCTVPARPSSTAKQHSDILDWLDELGGLHVGAGREALRNDDKIKKWDSVEEHWNRLQLLLHFLSEGQSYNEATLSVGIAQAQGKSRQALYDILDKEEKRRANPSGNVYSSSGGGGANWSKLSTKGDSGEKKSSVVGGFFIHSTFMSRSF